MGLAINFLRTDHCIIGAFALMASSCEIHLRTSNYALAKSVISQAYQEASRIEQHFSRYLKHNLLYRINTSQGRAITLDNEYTGLLNYALNLFQISDGMFDISSGVLHKHWSFDNRTHSVSEQEAALQVQQLRTLLELIGLNKITWNPPNLQMPAGMQLDFGGIGKEYAVDRASQVIEQQFDGLYLVNFGGDCYCRGELNQPWNISIEAASSSRSAAPSATGNAVTLTTGAVATSGTTKRYFLSGGQRYGHILNPKTGWPVSQAPLSVTVVNENCLSAGAMSTLAMLQGENAEGFLEQQQLLHWVLR